MGIKMVANSGKKTRRLAPFEKDIAGRPPGTGLAEHDEQPSNHG